MNSCTSLHVYVIQDSLGQDSLGQLSKLLNYMTCRRKPGVFQNGNFVTTAGVTTKYFSAIFEK